MPETSILLFHNRIYRTSLPLPMFSFSVLFKTRYNAKETANQIKRTQTGIRLASTIHLMIINVFDILFIFLESHEILTNTFHVESSSKYMKLEVYERFENYQFILSHIRKIPVMLLQKIFSSLACSICYAKVNALLHF